MITRGVSLCDDDINLTFWSLYNYVECDRVLFMIDSTLMIS